jgi:hypothetical protein
MKSCEELLEVERQKYIADQTKKGLAEAAILTTWKESVMVADTVEHKLSNAKRLTKDIKESRTRIQRKNGSAINEAGTEDRVQRYMKKGFTLRESYVMCGLKDPGPNAKQPAAFTESLVKAWKDYCGGLISESDAHTLASRGISPE